MNSPAEAPDIARTPVGNKLLRIGMFSESFHPVQNGVTTSVRTLVSELRRKGHHVWVFAPEHHDQPEHETDVVRFPSFVTQFNPQYPLAYPFLPRIKLASQIERLNLDVVHTHSPFVLGLTGADLAIRNGIPLISTFHTLYSEYSHYVSFLPEAFTHGLLEAFLPWYYNRCSTVICPSVTAGDHLRASGVDRQIEIVPTGIPIPQPDAIGADARAEVRSRLGIGPDTPLLLYAGRLAPEKQIPWLLDVFARIRERVPGVVLALAGGGPLLDPLTEHAKSLQIGDSTYFLGPVPRAEMDALYAAADLFVFPSPSETQGLVIGEARAAGTPAVVIDSGGAPETVRHGIDGFRIPEGDDDGFASCVVELLQDRELLDRVSRNAREAAGELSPEQMTARVLQIYEDARDRTAQPRNRDPREGDDEPDIRPRESDNGASLYGANIAE
jgi:1,2-diacylglycerol 3-alpha-glucosyltransferase